MQDPPSLRVLSLVKSRRVLTHLGRSAARWHRMGDCEARGASSAAISVLLPACPGLRPGIWGNGGCGTTTGAADRAGSVVVLPACSAQPSAGRCVRAPPSYADFDAALQQMGVCRSVCTPTTLSIPPLVAEWRHNAPAHRTACRRSQGAKQLRREHHRTVLAPLP